MSDREDYQHIMLEQEREIYEALRHAERLGLTEGELHLLRWATGCTQFQPRNSHDRSREIR